MSVTLPPSGTRGSTIPGFARPLLKAGMALSHVMFGILGDRMKVQGNSLLGLKSIGARTGKERHSVVARFADPEHPGAWLVVGSNGGAARHPAWCYNLTKNPDRVWIMVGHDEFKVRPELLQGAEREKAWHRIVSVAPGFGKYETTTDRKIPVFRMTPDSPA